MGNLCLWMGHNMSLSALRLRAFLGIFIFENKNTSSRNFLPFLLLLTISKSRKLNLWLLVAFYVSHIFLTSLVEKVMGKFYKFRSGVKIALFTEVCEICAHFQHLRIRYYDFTGKRVSKIFLQYCWFLNSEYRH